MKEKDKSQISKEVCQNGACGCSTSMIWLGIVVIIIVMALAVIFGN